mmetsp:Transcript_37220/g.73126  ORF Transcript_37220/g.73126 Transcript_37220/m.73126 type:complete len:204 (-) Transcript_37220:479-1090(-)
MVRAAFNKWDKPKPRSYSNNAKREFSLDGELRIGWCWVEGSGVWLLLNFASVRQWMAEYGVVLSGGSCLIAASQADLSVSLADSRWRTKEAPSGCPSLAASIYHCRPLTRLCLTEAGSVPLLWKRHSAMWCCASLTPARAALSTSEKALSLSTGNPHFPTWKQRPAKYCASASPWSAANCSNLIPSSWFFSNPNLPHRRTFPR